mmetsp:Transcript_27725/g.34467  ORF Transcript_27725/g.34467 Transcript_27725/m.34467 type:complete len:113 (+) Transcript_27725:244-582(+)
MFGDVGGLNDFLGLILTSVISFFSSNFMEKSLIEKIYHVSSSDPAPQRGSVSHDFEVANTIRPLKLSKCFVLIYALTGGRYPSSRKKRFAYRAAQEQLEKSLDIVDLISKTR